MKIKKSLSVLFECEPKAFWVLLGIFIIGYIFGVFVGGREIFALYPNGEVSSLNIFSDFTFGQVVIINILSILLSFVLGYSAIGFIFVCITLLCHGTIIGLYCAVNICLSGFKSIAITVICFYLYCLIFLFCEIIISFSSIKLSLSILNILNNTSKFNPSLVFHKMHFIKFIILLFICIVESTLVFPITKFL